MMLEFSKSRLEIIKKYEGLRLKSYDDATGLPVDSLAEIKGKLRIGYGVENNVPLQIIFPAGCIISDDQANRWLERFVKQKADVVNEKLAFANLNQNQFDAIVLLAYNVGEICIRPSNLLYQAIKAKDWEKASKIFPLYNKVNGKVNDQLTKRRLEERDIFLSK
jgi:lysozyme